jgi:hypothetical protein
MVSRYAGLRASGKALTATIRPTRMSMRWKSSMVAEPGGLNAALVS